MGVVAPEEEPAAAERALVEEQLQEALASCDRERASHLVAALARLARRERDGG